MTKYEMVQEAKRLKMSLADFKKWSAIGEISEYSPDDPDVVASMPVSELLGIPEVDVLEESED